MFDPSQKTLLADKGEIRVGGRYQVDPVQMPKEAEGGKFQCLFIHYENTYAFNLTYCEHHVCHS